MVLCCFSLFRLTQLLEEPPRESLHEVVFDENMVKEFGSSPVSGSGGGGVWSNLRRMTNDGEQPSSPSESDQFNQAKPPNPVTQGDDKEGEKEAASTSTMEEETMAKDTTASMNPTTLMDDNSDSTPESSSNSPEREGMDEKSAEGAQPFPLSRKRSSSMRESLDSSEGSRSIRADDERESDENDRRTVLQEADSTTLGEQDDNGQDVEEEGDIDLETEKEEDGDSDLEQSTPKKMRASSPGIESGSACNKKAAMSPKGVGNMDKSDTMSGSEACHIEVEKVKSHEIESKSSSSKVIRQPDLEEDGEEAESVTVGELHSSSGRETSTGQLEKSHDSNNDSKCCCSLVVCAYMCVLHIINKK